MNEQPEALRLADALEAIPFIGFVFDGIPGTEDPSIAKEAANELRRLHAQNKELLAAMNLATEQLVGNWRVEAFATLMDAMTKAEGNHG